MKFFNRLFKLLRHRWHDGAAHRFLNAKTKQYVADKLAESEKQHTCPIRFFVEGGLPYHYIKRDALPSERAYVLFGKKGLWDTQDNNGMLIYLLIADHAIEVFADRGLRARVDNAQWLRVIAPLQASLKNHNFKEGFDLAMQELTSILHEAFPASNQQQEAPIEAKQKISPSI